MSSSYYKGNTGSHSSYVYNKIDHAHDRIDNIELNIKNIEHDHRDLVLDHFKTKTNLDNLTDTSSEESYHLINLFETNENNFFKKFTIDKNNIEENIWDYFFPVKVKKDDIIDIKFSRVVKYSSPVYSSALKYIVYLMSDSNLIDNKYSLIMSPSSYGQLNQTHHNVLFKAEKDMDNVKIKFNVGFTSYTYQGQIIEISLMKYDLYNYACFKHYRKL